MSNTLGQKRSAFALEKVSQVTAEKFDKLVSGLPAMILQNGLGQTLAFLLSKATKQGRLQKNSSHYEAYVIMASWQTKLGRLKKMESPGDVIKELSGMPQSDYLEMQIETLALLEWVKRYANADLFGKG